MNSKPEKNMKSLQRIVKWLNKTQGRDKLCKFIQFSCLLLSCVYKSHDYYSLQFQTLFQSMKDTRKIFRLFKSIIEYQKLVAILLDDDDNLLKIFRILAQILFLFYWLFDNISILCKIKLLKGNYAKYNKLTSIFWTLSLLVSVPVLFIQSKDKRIQPKKAYQMKLDYMRYCLDLLPATYQSKIYQKIFKVNMKTQVAAIGGIISSAISTYGVLVDC